MQGPQFTGTWGCALEGNGLSPFLVLLAVWPWDEQLRFTRSSAVMHARHRPKAKMPLPTETSKACNLSTLEVDRLRVRGTNSPGKMLAMPAWVLSSIPKNLHKKPSLVTLLVIPSAEDAKCIPGADQPAQLNQQDPEQWETLSQKQPGFTVLEEQHPKLTSGLSAHIHMCTNTHTYTPPPPIIIIIIIRRSWVYQEPPRGMEGWHEDVVCITLKRKTNEGLEDSIPESNQVKKQWITVNR